VRMSVPMSPIPQGKKPQAPAETMAEPRPAVKPKSAPKVAKAAKPAREESASEGGSKKWLWAAMLLLVVGGGAGGVWKFQPQLLGLPANPVAPVAVNTTNLAVVPSGTVAAPSDPAEAAIDSAAIRDSIRRVDSLRLAFRADSLRIARAESIKFASQERERLRRLAAANATKSAPPPVVRTPETAPVATGTATIKIASGTPNAALYINGRIEGVISSAREVSILSGVPVRLSIRAQGCQDWDSTVTIPANTTKTIGRKFAKC
jgi:hypothetical protein